MSALRYAARSLGRARGFAIASIATIALAIGAGCAVFGLVNAVLLRPLPYPNADRLVGLWHTMPGLNLPLVKQAPGTFALYRDNARSLEANGIYFTQPATLAYANPGITPERVRIALFSASMFQVLGAHPLVGRLLTPSDGIGGVKPVAVISERLWRSRFAADRAAIGKHISVDGQQLEIVGVAPESFAFPDAATRLWVSLDFTGWPYVGGFAYAGVGRLRPGVTRAAAERELSQLLTRLPERYPDLKPGVSTANAMRQARLGAVVHSMRNDVVNGFDRVLWLIGGTVALLVLVAFSNVASLMLVRVESRQRDLAVRSALGASPLGIMKMLIAEAAIVAAIGGAIGLAIASGALRALIRIAPSELPRVNEVHIDTAVVLVALGLAMLFTLTSTAIGAVRLSAHDAMRILRDGGRTGTSGRATQRMRAAFVAVEVALSLVLLAGSGVLGRSIMKLRAVQPGFDASNVGTFWTYVPRTTYKTPADVTRFYREAVERMRRVPGVVAAAVTSKLPLELEGSPYQILIWADDGANSASELPPTVQSTATSSSYFATMKIPLLAGRPYDGENVRRGALETVVSRKFVERYWHDSTGRAGVGKRLRPVVNGPWFTIVGVVGDVRDSTLTEPPIAEVYFPEEAAEGNAPAAWISDEMAFVVRTRSTSAASPALLALLQAELRAMDPSLPVYRPATMAQVVTDARGRMSFALLILGVGAGATLLLGVVGLYGVIAYVVGLRSREISIRIALGLQPARAAAMILREGGKIVAIGAAAGLVVFLLSARLLGSLAFEVSPVDAATLAASVAAVVVVALIATWLPARQASRIDPAEVLKAD